MSMNLALKATRQVTTKSGKKSMQHKLFNLWQTPTAVTRHILSQKDVKEAYVTWLKSLCDYQFAPYHIQDLENWIKEIKEEDYDIEWFEH